MSTSNAHLPHMGVVLREGERVCPLELFFDRVSVLAITQCTTLRLAHEVDALVTVAVVGIVLWCLITFESLHYAESRDLVRHAEVS